MMRGSTNSIFHFTEKKPLFIIAGESWKGGDEIRIETSGCQFQLEFHLSRENLKKLFIAIRERLRDDVKSALFTQDDTLHLNLKEGEIPNRPATEVLRELKAEVRS